MHIDIYCDESRPDLLSDNRTEGFPVIGGCWLRQKKRNEIKVKIKHLRSRHKIGGEFKWNKISNSRHQFYLDLIDLFFELGNQIHFRSIVIDASILNLNKFHDNDTELGFYKFYYQMLVRKLHWPNKYTILCDHKSTRNPNRLRDLEACLRNACGKNTIHTVQSVKSEESLLIQLVDVLTGAVSSKFNDNFQSTLKAEVIERIEKHLGHPIKPTSLREAKFNVFKILLKG